MAGNSQRRGRRLTPKAGAPKGSGGKNKDSLAGRGRTLPADERPWHKAYSGTEKLPQRTAWKQEKERRAATEEGRAPKIGQPGTKDTTWGKGSRAGVPLKGGKGKAGGRSGPRVAPGRRSTPAKDSPELLVGRNPVLESLRANVPATALYTAQGIDVDDRVKEIVRTAADRGIAILEVSRAELDRMTGGVLHQGVGLQVPPFAYEPFEDLVAASLEQAAPLLVALDGVTDPRNLGAVIRSAAAFGAQGVFVPERRAAGITATAWRTSAGAAARVPVAQVTNLTRSLKACKDAGFVVVGLDADGETDLYDLEAAVGPLVVVVGSEGRGLSRLVGETCDLTVSIPMISDVESLNASVAAAVTLAEVARRRSVEA
ncbi:MULTISPECIES: 23S rRNA (guanosine(2251)-2'-O)-methyltransferase RlmB [Micromonospora]|uniref:23S rRNA (Guanosine(2251)-2'-O)-methyltransferase RlmB n=1 Tax=Micromonospora solifontis TaxID=2487138 RepID=A0ABX9WJG8_9ACTN|nr:MULTISPECIES: 23S rRNA (guanosine(2251)-2'-O)-methyltransferase RlmB [Micromonospora]NES14640.1 23S rRNA (guanosine(2251)-2'-O)-methyltransferase RlmB [Micromonospora sp. PPF5-17B]NES36622.1 23S rRNA (guanosine(2251)-2'-O)-methyltransferase RlmB [Micromonospora solifontis]NES55648.1 23S rRNA (guanosine(2251)-2'-O)-methyltransferase RlmB [Micromonospora sp. PPF5-6]RNL99219.1 23S rRNA (guanosine(2251)-2'-O)-methyltransferase RlmB [Micromonospora solifontis]